MKWLFAIAVVVIAWRWFGVGRPRTATSEDNARSLLGVARGADAETIRAAHRRLVAGIHPDRGGSAELTGRANAARDLLLQGDERR